MPAPPSQLRTIRVRNAADARRSADECLFTELSEFKYIDKRYTNYRLSASLPWDARRFPWVAGCPASHPSPLAQCIAMLFVFLSSAACAAADDTANWSAFKPRLVYGGAAFANLGGGGR